MRIISMLRVATSWKSTCSCFSMNNVQQLFTDQLCQKLTGNRLWNLLTKLSPAVSLDGSDSDRAPLPQTNPYVCSKKFIDALLDSQVDICQLTELFRWRANRDMQYCITRERVCKICHKVWAKVKVTERCVIVQGLKDDDHSAVQKLLIHTIADRDYVHMASRYFIVLSLKQITSGCWISGWGNWSIHTWWLRTLNTIF